MRKALRLINVCEVGVSPEFFRQTRSLNMEIDWCIFNIHISTTALGTSAFQSIGKWFCYFFGIPIITTNTLWVPKISQRNGDVVRYKDVSVALEEFGLKQAWDGFMQRRNYAYLNDNKSSLLSGRLVHWCDVHRFFSNFKINCKSLLTSKEPLSFFLKAVASSFPNYCQKQLTLVRYAPLVENGNITPYKALKKLKIATRIEKVLFVCRSNIQRSLTAEHLFKPMFANIEFLSAGVSKKECVRNHSTLCTEELINWADCVFVFDQLHIDRIRDNTGGVKMQKVINLGIEDIYKYGDPHLIILLKSKLEHILSRTNLNRSHYP